MALCSWILAGYVYTNNIYKHNLPTSSTDLNTRIKCCFGQKTQCNAWSMGNVFIDAFFFDQHIHILLAYQFGFFVFWQWCQRTSRWLIWSKISWELQRIHTMLTFCRWVIGIWTVWNRGLRPSLKYFLSESAEDKLTPRSLTLFIIFGGIFEVNTQFPKQLGILSNKNPTLPFFLFFPVLRAGKAWQLYRRSGWSQRRPMCWDHVLGVLSLITLFSTIFSKYFLT